MRHRPYSLVGPGQALVSLLVTLPFRGERSAGRRGGFAKPPMDGGRSHPVGRFARASPPFRRREAPPGAPRAAFYRCAGRASENVDQPHLSASSWRQVVVPASGAPPSPGSERLRSPSPAAPHQPTVGFPRLADPVSLDHISGPPSPLLRLHGVPCRRPSKSRTSDYKHIGLGSVNSPLQRFCAAVRHPSS